jgi:hypothetical protein
MLYNLADSSVHRLVVEFVRLGCFLELHVVPARLELPLLQLQRRQIVVYADQTLSRYRQPYVFAVEFVVVFVGNFAALLEDRSELHYALHLRRYEHHLGVLLKRHENLPLCAVRYFDVLNDVVDLQVILIDGVVERDSTDVLDEAIPTCCSSWLAMEYSRIMFSSKKYFVSRT